MSRRRASSGRAARCRCTIEGLATCRLAAFAVHCVGPARVQRSPTSTSSVARQRARRRARARGD